MSPSPAKDLSISIKNWTPSALRLLAAAIRENWECGIEDEKVQSKLMDDYDNVIAQIRFLTGEET